MQSLRSYPLGLLASFQCRLRDALYNSFFAIYNQASDNVLEEHRKRNTHADQSRLAIQTLTRFQELLTTMASGGAAEFIRHETHQLKLKDRHVERVPQEIVWGLARRYLREKRSITSFRSSQHLVVFEEWAATLFKILANKFFDNPILFDQYQRPTRKMELLSAAKGVIDQGVLESVLAMVQFGTLLSIPFGRESLGTTDKDHGADVNVEPVPSRRSEDAHSTTNEQPRASSSSSSQPHHRPHPQHAPQPPKPSVEDDRCRQYERMLAKQQRQMEEERDRREREFDQQQRRWEQERQKIRADMQQQANEYRQERKELLRDNELKAQRIRELESLPPPPPPPRAFDDHDPPRRTARHRPSERVERSERSHRAHSSSRLSQEFEEDDATDDEEDPDDPLDDEVTRVNTRRKPVVAVPHLSSSTRARNLPSDSDEWDKWDEPSPAIQQPRRESKRDESKSSKIALTVAAGASEPGASGVAPSSIKTDVVKELSDDLKSAQASIPYQTPLPVNAAAVGKSDNGSAGESASVAENKQ